MDEESIRTPFLFVFFTNERFVFLLHNTCCPITQHVLCRNWIILVFVSIIAIDVSSIWYIMKGETTVMQRIKGF